MTVEFPYTLDATLVAEITGTYRTALVDSDSGTLDEQIAHAAGLVRGLMAGCIRAKRATVRIVVDGVAIAECWQIVEREFESPNVELFTECWPALPWATRTRLAIEG
jgi:hypothetical protein